VFVKESVTNLLQAEVGLVLAIQHRYEHSARFDAFLKQLFIQPHLIVVVRIGLKCERSHEVIFLHKHHSLLAQDRHHILQQLIFPQALQELVVVLAQSFEDQPQPVATLVLVFCQAEEAQIDALSVQIVELDRIALLALDRHPAL
jgi:hypothetical protein